MYALPSSFKHTVLFFLLITTLGLYIPHRAEAVLGVGDVVSDFINEVMATIDSVVNTISSYDTSSIDLKEYVLDPLAYLAAQTVIRAMTNQILGWIQGDDAGFVANLDKEFRRTADEVGGEFLNNLSGINLCGDIGAYLRISLRLPGLRQRLTCTVTGIVGNLQRFAQNFQNGGWKSFFSLQLTPQNTRSGAYMIALDAKIFAEKNSKERTALGYQAGSGFLGFKVPTKENCFTVDASAGSQAPGEGVRGSEQNLDRSSAPTTNRGFAAIGGAVQENNSTSQKTTTDNPNLPSIEKTFGITPTQEIQNLQQPRTITDQGSAAEEQQAGQQFTGALSEEGVAGPSIATGQAAGGARKTLCTKEYTTKTPGKIVGDALSGSVLSGLHSAQLADEIDEGIGAIVSALITKMLSSSSGSGGGLIGDSSLANLPPIPMSANIRYFTDKIDPMIFKLQGTEQALDKKIIEVGIKISKKTVEINTLQGACQSTTVFLSGCDTVTNLQNERTTLEQERTDLLTAFTQIDKQLNALLELRDTVATENNPLVLKDIDTYLTSLLISAGVTEQSSKGKDATPLGATQPGFNFLDIEEAAITHATSTLAFLDQKITLTATSTAELRSVRDAVTQKRKELLSLHDQLEVIRFKELSQQLDSPGSNFAVTLTTEEAIGLIRQINTKVLEAYKL